ncbi:MAG: MG2 domain-containing protein [Treponema sp.]
MNTTVLIITILILMFPIGCKNSNQRSQIAKLQEASRLKHEDPNISDFEKLFIPQYAIETPEPVQEAKLPVFRVNASKAVPNDVSVIPGLRTLTAYKTAYISDRSAVPVQPETQKPKGAVKDSGPLTIADWGPKGKIPAVIENPSLYVVFSLPVNALAMLPEPSAVSDYMSITPAVKGVFRWYGSRYLAFEAQESLIPGQEYTITVKDGVQSLSGKRLEGKRQFTVKSEDLKITDSRIGYTFVTESKTWIYIDRDDVIPEAANEVLLTFNYPVKADTLKSAVYAEVQEEGKQPVRYTCTLTQKESHKLFARIDGTIPHNADVTIGFRQADGKTAAIGYHTLRSFRVKSAESRDSSELFENPVHFVFSHNVRKESVLGNIKTEPLMPITDKNIEVIGDRLILHGLPVHFNSTYTVQLLSGITDVYGRNLTADSQHRITVPEASGYVHFLDSGRRMLEANYPHTFLFEYRNILESAAYSVVKTDNPLYTPWNSAVVEAVKKELNVTMRNKRQFEAVDLNPYLDNGKGFVRFDAVINYTDHSPWNDSDYSTATNCTTIQVTDLGITVRSAINKTVVLVTSLATGEPVEGAAVYIYNGSTYGDTILNTKEGVQNAFVSGTTDKNGTVILTYDSRSIPFFKKAGTGTAVFVEKDGDRAVFYPTSHDPWQEGIYTVGQTEGAIEGIQRTFMFSDRGLYKPGEKLLFRGIDRDQQMSSFTPYTGSYTITLEEYNWEDPKIIETITGSCSKSGGFWGSFDLPKDIKPGDYLIKYKREGTKHSAQELAVTVAYFEKLKFQTAVTLPKETVISGQTLTGTVSASYLSGGGIAHAAYRGNWVRQGADFRPEHPALKHYTFGPSDTDYGMDQLDSFSGKTAGDGSAEISCKTAEAGVIGSPYRYFAEASVTDASNQEISARNSILVHPAAFYAGLGRPENLTGFAKKGETLTFPFILASPDGEPLDSAKLAAGDFTAELLREDWKLVQQQGAAKSIYASYEKEIVSEYSTTVKAAAKGTISITPKNAGYHTLTLSGADKNGKPVKTEYRFYVTGSGAVFWNRNFESSLRLTPDQSLYNPGDTARILLESPLPAGTYLITVEREGIFTEEIRHIEGNTQVLEIPIAQNYVPVVYVTVSSYSVRTGAPKHTYGEPDLDKPKGFFGATAVFVNARVKAFSIDIAADKKTYKPGEKAVLTLTAKQGGKPLADAELTLLAVDRGVLDLIDYHVPNPLDFFYNPENFPLCVTGGDSRSWLMDPVTYEIKNLYGGDSDDGKGDGERSDFNPTAVFMPILKTDANGQVKAEFTFPDSLTSYRITALGVQGELLALHEEEITVQNTVNILPVMPRRLRERDTAECGVLISNLDRSAHSVTVNASLRTPQSGNASAGLVREEGKAFIDGKTQHTVKVEGRQQAVVYFDLAAVQSGEIEVVFDIRSDILNEKLIQPLIIERPFVFETVTAVGTIEKNEKEASEGVVIPSLADSNTGSLSVTLDSSRLGLLSSAVRYVFDYPYNCMEQQSSRMLPLVIFGKYIDVFGMNNKVADVRETVRSVFADWAEIQQQNGAFPYWPGGEYSSFYVSLRVAHVCAAAKKHGYTEQDIAVNTAALTAYLNKAFQQNTEKLSPYLQAYSGYVLSLYGIKVPQNLLNGLAAQEGNPAVQALTGLIYLQRGDKERAAACAAVIKRYLRPTARGFELSLDDHGRTRFWFDNDIALDYALAVQFLVQLDSGDETVTRLLHTLMERQRAGYWQSTSITAQVFSAFDALITYRNLEATDMTAAAALGGQELTSGAFKGLEAKPVSAVLPFAEAPVQKMQRDTLLPLSFSKKGTGQLYYTASLMYALPQEMQTMRDEGLGIDYTIRDTASGKVLTASSPVIALESGKVYEAEVRLSSGKDYTFVALRVPVPSGAEILDTAFVTTAAFNESEENTDEPWQEERLLSSQRIYDNEVQYFWNEWERGSSTLRFKFRAARRGVFPCPPAVAECMYEPEIFGRSSGTLFTIK